TWRLGDLRWACPDAGARTDVAFARDGELLAALPTAECLRGDARREVQALAADGYDVSLLSGDTQARVDVAADACDIPRDRAFGEHDPRAKAAFVSGHDASHTLFVGDGVNDALAIDRALVSGTPAVD